jgi:hypothetical protein
MEGHGEAVLDGPDRETDRQVSLADPRWALDQQILLRPDPGAGGERLDPTALDAGLEGEVEVAEGLPRRQAREPQLCSNGPK